MAQFSFQCVPGHHKFTLDIDTGDKGRDENHPEYKRLRSLLVCSYPGCGATAAKGEIQNDVAMLPVTREDKLSKLRKENREQSAIARRQAAEMQRDNPQRVTELDYIPSGTGDRSKFGGDRIKIPTSVIESLNEKGKQFAPPPEP